MSDKSGRRFLIGLGGARSATKNALDLKWATRALLVEKWFGISDQFSTEVYGSVCSGAASSIEFARSTNASSPVASAKKPRAAVPAGLSESLGGMQGRRKPRAIATKIRRGRSRAVLLPLKDQTRSHGLIGQ